MSTTPIHPVSDLSAADLRRLLDASADVRLLDVRAPGEFAAGHIKGAVNIPLEQVRDVAADIAGARATTVVLICQSGGRAITARDILLGAGCADLAVLSGGMGAWNGAGGGTDARPGQWTLERQVRLVAGAMVFTGVALSTVWAPAKFFSGAVGAGLVFAAVSNTCTMGVLLAKLPYNRGRSCDLDSAVRRLTR